ncbi:MAG: FKBP-type peptidyl-prolyl cis-trans isomerase [Paludibacteraceae bacterium]|jgi:FKBP-type peptidyl-prolyl cis-trans isomerase FklB|nr:FKBP-type peptidyl-prolyl cis-trans isomerase [Paludibacteraceae bacterium]MEE1082389.1 FKBP-type peptidyl-prolyl cis-trans isomerase [Paludibacteraceae bacterium]
MDKLSYALGMSMASNMKQSGLDCINVDDFASAIKSVFNGEKMQMTPEEAQNAINEFFAKQKTEVMSKNKKAGEEFLAQNKSKEGVQTTASGLQYKVLVAGTGAKPKATDTVDCHYEGRLIDGTVFDSSYRRGQSAQFPVNGVIPGWVEALQMMPVGSKWQLYIPSELAYGEYGAGETIEPNSTLVFDVELLGIK